MCADDVPLRLLPAALVGSPSPAGRGLSGVGGSASLATGAKGRGIPGIREVKENEHEHQDHQPHPAHREYRRGGGCDLPPSGQVARVSANTTELGRVNGIPCYAVTYGKVEGLPEPLEDTIFVVSALVRTAVPNRRDVASPGELVRDPETKQPVGCRGLAVNG